MPRQLFFFTGTLDRTRDGHHISTMKLALTIPKPGKANRKTGDGVAVIMAPRSTCPGSCPMRPVTAGGNGACYAEQWPMALHWTALDSGQRGADAADTIAAISQLPTGLPVRYATAGDLPGDGRTIDTALATALVTATQGRRAWTYTHHRDGATIAALNSVPGGMTVNVSTDSLSDADASIDAGHPTVTVLPLGTALRGVRTPAGVPVITCPAQIPGSEVTCSECDLCARKSRPYVIGFIAHGGRAKKLVPLT